MRKKSNNAWKKGEPLAFLQSHVGYAGDACLIWPFTRNPYGYGSFGADGKVNYAHRWMCEAVHGPAPTPEHQAAHDCGNGGDGCIHPKHVFWKTPLENSQDKILHGTTYSGKGRKRQKLTQEQVDEIRKITTVAEQFETARRFGCSASNIRKILYGKAWKVPKRFNEFSDDDIRRIRSLKGSARPELVAAEYQVSCGVIYNIWRGASWAHVA